MKRFYDVNTAKVARAYWESGFKKGNSTVRNNLYWYCPIKLPYPKTIIFMKASVLGQIFFCTSFVFVPLMGQFNILLIICTKTLVYIKKYIIS